MAKQKTLTFIEFMEHFPTEEDCHRYLFNMKWPSGFVCSRCGNSQAYEIGTRKFPLYQCTRCRHQTTVTAGTVFEKTRTDLRKWFMAIFLVANDKRGVSAMYLREQLGVSYPTAWTILHKIRKAMRDRDSAYMLDGIVEIDDAFFGAPTEGGKRGRGTEKTKVLIALSLHRRGNPLYVKMEVVPDLTENTIVDFATRNITEGSEVNSDMYRAYTVLAKEGYPHQAKEFQPKEHPDHLGWLHTIISNAKAFFGGTFHGIDRKHLQAYLDEFCYRFNRRKFKGEIFNRLANCCLLAGPMTYAELVR